MPARPVRTRVCATAHHLYRRGAHIRRIADSIRSLKGGFGTHTAEIISGASVAFVLKVLSAGLAFVLNVLLSRMLGAELAGVYFMAFTVAALAAVIGRAGLDNTLLRYVASGAATGDWASVKGVYAKGMTYALILSAVVTLAVIVAARPIAGQIFSKPELAAPIALMALSIVPTAVFTLFAELLKGLKLIRDSILVQSVIVTALTILGVFIAAPSWGLSGVILSYTIAAFATCVIAVYIWRKATPMFNGTRGSFSTSRLFESSMPLFWVSLLNLLINSFSTFALGAWSTNSDVGIFNVASRTALLISFVLIAVNAIAAPKFAALYSIGDTASLEKTARNSAKIMTLFASPVLLVFLLAPGTIMSFFGPDFAEGGGVLSILSVGQFINVVTGSVGYLLMMSGREKLIRNNIMFVTVINVLLNFALVPRHGVIGAAIATSASLSIMNIISTVLVRTSLGIWVLPGWRAKIV